MTLKEMVQLESSVEQIVSELREKLKTELSNAEIPGVKKISPLCSVVNFSALNKGILSAEHYNVETQSNYIAQYLAPCKTVTSLAGKLTEIINDGKVKLGCNTHVLHPEVINVVRKFVENN